MKTVFPSTLHPLSNFEYESDIANVLQLCISFVKFPTLDSSSREVHVRELSWGSREGPFAYTGKASANFPLVRYQKSRRILPPRIGYTSRVFFLTSGKGRSVYTEWQHGALKARMHQQQTFTLGPLSESCRRRSVFLFLVREGARI